MKKRIAKQEIIEIDTGTRNYRERLKELNEKLSQYWTVVNQTVVNNSIFYTIENPFG